ncbi:type II secretion system protein GspN [bacterium]|nr:type II secretion system protein GspN [bacterium]
MTILNSLQNFGKRSGKLLAPLLAIVFFIFGCIYFFPIQSLETQLNSQLSQQTRQDVRVINPKLGTGLGLGLFSGGLIALKAERVEIFMPRESMQIDCNNFILTPNLLALFTLKLHVSIQCQIEKGGPSTILASVKTPVWSFNDAELNIELEDIRLDHLAKMFKAKGWMGKLNGDVSITGITQGMQSASFAWDVNGTGFATPALRSDLLSLPAMVHDRLQTSGEFTSGNVVVEELQLGVVDVTPMWATFSSAGLKLDAKNFPIDGKIKGRIKTDPEWEKKNLTTFNMTSTFGKVKESGMREFTKEVVGNVTSLLFNPPIE